MLWLILRKTEVPQAQMNLTEVRPRFWEERGISDPRVTKFSDPNASKHLVGGQLPLRIGIRWLNRAELFEGPWLHFFEVSAQTTNDHRSPPELRQLFVCFETRRV